MPRSATTQIDAVSSLSASPVGSIAGTFDLPRLFESRFSILNSGSFGRDLTSYSDVLRAEYARQDALQPSGPRRVPTARGG